MNKEELERFKKNVEEIPEESLVCVIPVVRKISKEAFDTAQFIFWLIYGVEMQLKEIARDVMTKNRKDQDYNEIKQFVEDVFEEMTLMGKISLIEKNLKRENQHKNFKNLPSILKELNNIRNTIFHQKTDIQNIKYFGKIISERSTKNQMIVDLTTGFSGYNQKTK